MACIEFSDIIRSSERQVDLLNLVADKNPDLDVPGACENFSRQVRMVESVVSGTYVLAVELTRKTESLSEIAAVWKGLEGVCNKALQAVGGLKEKYPACGTPELYDRLLDYKLACTRRHDEANEEILCQTMTTPKGLFPSLT